MSQQTPIVAFEVELPSTGPWWSPDADEPPAGAVLVADLISRHGGTERDGWAYVYACAAGTCPDSFGVSPVGAEQPTMCASCGAPVRPHQPAQAKA